MQLKLAENIVDFQSFLPLLLVRTPNSRKQRIKRKPSIAIFPYPHTKPNNYKFPLIVKTAGATSLHPRDLQRPRGITRNPPYKAHY